MGCNVLARLGELVGNRYGVTQVQISIPHFRVNARTLRTAMRGTPIGNPMEDGRIHDGLAGSKRFGVFSGNIYCLAVFLRGYDRSGIMGTTLACIDSTRFQYA